MNRLSTQGRSAWRTLVLAGGVCIAALAVATAAWAFLGGGATQKTALVHKQGPAGSSRKRPSTEEGWPNLFGPAHNSVSPDSQLALDWPAGGPPEKWRRTIGTGYSAPVASGNAVVTFCRQGDHEVIECLDAGAGATRWSIRYPTSFKCPYHYSDGPYSTPVIDRQHVYAWGAEGELHCLDLKTGQPLWQRSLNSDYQVAEREFPVGGSPLLEWDRLILNVGGTVARSGIVALDKRSGKTLWTATDQGASFATPLAATIHGRRHVFVFTAEGLVSLDPATGRVWWSFPFRAKNPDKVNATSPVVHGDLVFVSGYSLGSLCLRVLPDGSCQEIWRDVRALDSQYNNLLCIEGHVYGFSAIHRDFRCLDLRTGEVLWEWPHEIGRGASLAVGNRFLLLGEQGHLASMEISPRKPLLRSMTAKPIVKGPCFIAPALHRGLLYVRSEKQLVCFDLDTRVRPLALRRSFPDLAP